jgi:hypothetical protein
MKLTNEMRYEVLMEAGDRSRSLGMYTRSTYFYGEARDYAATEEQRARIDDCIKAAVQGAHDAMDR